jgi:transposase
MVAEKRLPRDLMKIISFLEPWREGLAGVVVESAYNWYGSGDGLQEAGFEVRLANTWAIETYDGLKHSGDKTDARHLAHLLRLGLLPTGNILPPEQRAIRDLARKRMPWVRSRTSHLLAIQNIVTRRQGIALGSSQIKRLTPEGIGQMGLPADVALAIESNLAVINTRGTQIDRLEKRLQESMEFQPEYDLLTSVPDIGRILVVVIALETGAMERFTELGHFAFLRPLLTVSGSATARRKGKAMSRTATNTWLGPSWKRRTSRCVFAPRPSASMSARRPGRIRRWRPRRWHKLARACYHILKERQPFDVKRCFA